MKTVKVIAVLLFIAIFFTIAPAQNSISTISIVAVDTLTGDIGVAVLSRTMASGAIVPYAKAGVGAVATQGAANLTYGPLGLEMMARDVIPEEAIGALLSADIDTAPRQVAMVNAKGSSFAFTASGVLQKASQDFSNGYAVIGNSLSSESVVKVISRTFEITPGILAERLLASIEAGAKANTDAQYRSAALLVVRDHGGYMGYNDRYIDIRVDDNAAPMDELKRIFKLWSERFFSDAQLRSIEMFMAQNNVTAARAELQRLVGDLNAQLKEKPDDPDVLNRIALILATYDIDRERALDLAKRASKITPDNDKILSTLAECHFFMGQYDDALKIGAELVKRNPDNDNYWKRLQKYKEEKEKRYGK